MDNTEVQKLINPKIENIEKNEIESACLYAFKSKPIKDVDNDYVTLNYESFNTNMTKKDVLPSAIAILNYFKKNYLSKSDKKYEVYNIENPKNVIDYIHLKHLDFNDPDVLNGTKKDIDVNNYKVQYLLNSIISKSEIAHKSKDYKGLRYTAIVLTPKKGSPIILINKCTPIYKPRNLLYLLDEEKEILNYKPVENALLKLPFIPNIIIVDNYCFMIANDIESIFGFEAHNKMLSEKVIKALPKSIKLDDSSLKHIEQYVRKGKNHNLFAAFNDEYLKSIKNNDTHTLEIITNELKIKQDENKKFEITNENEAERFVHFICGFIKKDLYDTNKYVYSKKNEVIQF